MRLLGVMSREAADGSTFTPQLVPSQPITTDDLERDAVFSQRVRLFGWIREKHLDVPEGEASQGFIGFAQQGASGVGLMYAGWDPVRVAHPQSCSRSTITRRRGTR